MANTIPIPLPLKGFYEGSSYQDQPVGTTPSCLNMRTRDPLTDRLRLTTRLGIEKFNASRVSGANAVVEGLSVTRIDGRVTYTPVESVPAEPGIVAQVALPSYTDCLDIQCDQQSNLYVAAATSGGGTGRNFVIKYNSALTEQWQFAVPMQRNTDVVKAVRLDEEGGIYVVVQSSARSATGGPTRIYKLEETGLDFAPVRIAWAVDAPQGGWFTCCAVGMGVMYAVEDTNAGGVYLHRWDDIDAANPNLTWSAKVRNTAGEECYCIDIADDGGAILGFVDPTSPPAAVGHVEKFGPTAPTGGPPVTPVWTYTNASGGIGQAVKNKGGFIYTQGYGTGGTPAYVRKLVDAGGSVSSSASRATAGGTQFKGASSLDVDDNGNVYLTTDDAGGTDVILEKVVPAFSSTAFDVTGDDLGTAGTDAMCVAVDPKYADAGATVSGGPIAEYIYVGTVADSVTHYAVHKLRIANVATSAGTPRETFSVAVAANGDIRKVTSAAVSSPSGFPSLDASRWIAAAAGLNVVLFTDGRQYKKLDLLNGTNGTVSDWNASAGEIPRRGRLLSIWQNCANLAGFEENAHQWAMSARGDFDFWDFFPAATGGPTAVLGSDSRAGLCPDAINCLAPWTDDLQIFGCDHTIQRMTGHPLDDGRFDVVSDITGMAWGRPFCKDPNGVLYFVGSRGGFFRLIPGSAPDEISLDPLSDRFRDMDIGAYRIRLVWNDREKGVHVFITPYTPGTTTHYFWSARENAWLPDRFASTNHDPMSAWITDGDAATDRLLLMGCQDGYIRKWSESTKNDDGSAIDSWVYIPVIMPPGEYRRLNNWRAVMAMSSDDATLTAYELECPDFNLINADPLSATSSITATFSATVSAGRNEGIHEPVRGNAVLVRVRNNTVDKRWSIESLTADEGEAGRSRKA